MNPLFARELRLRWRDRRAWLLMFVLALALAMLAGVMFYDGTSHPPEQQNVVWTGTTYIYQTPNISPVARAARAGRELFMALALGNLAAWLIIAPILTSTPIARERERGLLESLQLSRMHPISQIAARFGAALVFVVALQLAVMPVYASVFWLGGVSLEEMRQVAVLLAWSAMGGAALGFWISARSHRPPGAMFAAFGSVIGWTIAAGVAATFLAAMPLITLSWFYWPLAALIWTHPLTLVALITDSGPLSGLLSPPFGLELGGVVAWDGLIWGAASLVWLWMASRWVARPLTVASWGSQASAPVEWWRRSLAARQARAETAKRARIGQRVEGVLMADLPIEPLTRFPDLLLAREVRSRFRLRRGTWAVMLGRFALLFVGVSVWMWAVFSLIYSFSRAGVGSALMWMLWALGTLSVGALAATSFARERESGTWEGLKLSLLTPLEIVRAKWLSPLIAFGYYAGALIFLLPWSAGWGGRSGPSVGALLLAGAITVLWLGATSMIGLVISWRARTPGSGLGLTLTLLAIFLVAVPLARDVTGFDERVSEIVFGVELNRYDDYGRDYSPTQRRAQSFRRLYSLLDPPTALSHAFGEGQTRSVLAPSAAMWVQLGFCGLIMAGGGAWLSRQIGRERERG